jgi:hypothetical protein
MLTNGLIVNRSGSMAAIGFARQMRSGALKQRHPRTVDRSLLDVPEWTVEKRVKMILWCLSKRPGGESFFEDEDLLTEVANELGLSPEAQQLEHASFSHMRVFRKDLFGMTTQMRRAVEPDGRTVWWNGTLYPDVKHKSMKLTAKGWKLAQQVEQEMMADSVAVTVQSSEEMSVAREVIVEEIRSSASATGMVTAESDYDRKIEGLLIILTNFFKDQRLVEYIARSKTLQAQVMQNIEGAMKISGLL